MSRIAAVILAGGEGRRLGGALKAKIRIGNQSLLHCVTQALGGDAEPILVSIGPHAPSRFDLQSGHIAVSDANSHFHGPIAGLAAAVRWLQQNDPHAEFLVSAAVDTPFFPTGFVDRALPLIQGQQAVLAAYAGQLYPPNALWRLEALAGLPEAFAHGKALQSPRALAESIGARTLDWVAFAGQDPFANLNTLQDLFALQKRAAISKAF
jgi:molybdenum cofactor guanylyltransferase